MDGSSIRASNRITSKAKSGGSIEGQGIYVDPNSKIMFEAFSLFMLQ